LFPRYLTIPRIPNHTKLPVRHRANAFSVTVHRAAREFPPHGAPGLKSQLLGAVGSIAANIAESAGRDTRAQFAHFVTIAIGSANEAETHLELARGLDLLPEPASEALVGELDQIRRMLFGLRKHLQQPELH